MVVAVVIISSGQETFGEHPTDETVRLSTTASNGTGLDSIPFTVVFSDPEHELTRAYYGVGDGNPQRIDVRNPGAITDPASEPIYIGAKHTSGLGIRGTGDGQFDYPRAIVVNDTGHIFVADSNNRRIQVFDMLGNYVSQFGNEGQNRLGSPQGIAIDSTGNIFVTDTTNHRVQKYDHNGNFVSQFGSGPGNGNGTFNSPQGIAVNSTHIFVVDANNFRIQIFEKDGTYVSKFGQLGTGNGQFLRPTAIAIDSTGNIFPNNF